MRAQVALVMGVVLAALVALAPVDRAQTQERLGREVEIEDPTGTVLPSLQRALARAGRGEGVARLSFWGASHTASDQYTGFLRALLQRRFGDAGAGLVMPAMPFDLYARRDVTIEGGRGWRGVAVRGRDRAAGRYGRAGFALETSVRTRARVLATSVAHAELWTMSQSGGGRLQLAVDGVVASELSTDSPDTVLAYLEANVARGRHSVDVLSAGDGPVRVFGALLETGSAGVIVESFGVPGARARDQLPWDEGTLRAHVGRRMPDLIALAYGTNESGDRSSMATLETDLRTVIERWHRVAPGVSCLVIGPSDWPVSRAGARVARPRTTEVRNLYRRVAIAGGCGFFDLLAFQGGAGAMPRWVVSGLALSDHVHMTDAGHEQLAAVLDRALRRGMSPE